MNFGCKGPREWNSLGSNELLCVKEEQDLGMIVCDDIKVVKQIMDVESIGKENKTSITEFILLGFSDIPHLQLLISVTVFLIFMISVLGNFMFLILVSTDPHLQKPMYFFLSNLSFLDICNTSVSLSTLLHSLLTGKTLISFSLCLTQLYFFISFLGIEIFLLTAMAYDRYVAICNPLRYVLIMNKRICVLLSSVSWIIGFMDVIPHIFLTSQFSFCRGNEINHFFCDFSVLLKLSCSDMSYIETVVFTEGVFVSFIPFGLTLTSYICIISSILKMCSAKGRYKAFSTCSSHLTIVILFYGTLICVYIRPSSTYAPDQDKFFSLLFTALIPMLNPIIYSLRNEEVKRALRKYVPMSHNGE
ncbi:olfactory receptor 2AP1-like [Microcaecilia unicolor]|uniref:Olfactory receptor n=1 Tax=Microcaecilia unicolor TaxID=1415580 RepID=A0A6P7XJT0_9AMPH|nr:olfactory receptor 2AP1-like [Microcaecilia unicolor]